MVSWEMKKGFKALWMIGGLLLFISLFIDNYYYYLFDWNGAPLGTWGFNQFGDWYGLSISSSALATSFAPTPLEVPFYLTLFFIIILFIGLYGILFKDPEHLKKEIELDSLTSYAYLNFFVVGISCFYILVFPALYLFGNVFLPVLQVRDPVQEIVLQYAVGPGYIMQSASFVLLFPYSMFYYRVITTFYAKQHTPDKVITKYIEQTTTSLDLDRMIQEEELKREGFIAESVATILKEKIYGEKSYERSKT